ncbi:MAG TPA: dethiobiotin synthase [Desulfurivibrionaceae bacterium]|nr:dethiobiotin synthase [Desulfurivibrionaceae bacterium]
MKQTLFVTATDTGVGKTLVCGLLLRFLQGQGIAAGYQKWVSTGGATSPDLSAVAELAEMAFPAATRQRQVPYCFAFPASPHLAAELEGRRVDAERIAEALGVAQAACEFLVVEGVGGVLVPLHRELLLADLVARFRLPALIVARSGLGTINHTLLTIEALRQREVSILGVVLTDSFPHEEETIVADNLRTIAAMGRVPVLGRLPWCAEADELHHHFAPIGEAILSRLPA